MVYKLPTEPAEAAWRVFVSRQTHPENWPSWGELLAQGHQGMHRVNEFREYAAAAREWTAAENI